MKRLWIWLTGGLYGLLAISGFSFAHHTTTSELKVAKISNINQNTPLYLEHSGATYSNPADIIQSQHYSHSSHYSHYSHESHQSHYSHYSSR